VCPARRIAAAAAGSQEEPVYRYQFGHHASAPPKTASLGAFHGLELFYVFQTMERLLIQPTEGDLEVEAQLLASWAGLAADGNPSPAGAAPWETYDPGRDNALYIAGGAIAMTEGVRTARCDFWDEVTPGAGN